MTLKTITVVEDEPFDLPKEAIFVNMHPMHWSMDGKTRWRLTMILEDQNEKKA